MKKITNYTHDELCHDLAFSKGQIGFINANLGSAWCAGPKPGKADVIIIKPSYTRFNIDIYEVKRSRGDFLNDIKKEKYKKYLDCCNRFYYACLSDICKKDEIPDGLGLIVREKKGWITVKGATLKDTNPPDDVYLSLLFQKAKGMDIPYFMSRKYYNENIINYDNVCSIAGRKIGKRFQDAEYAISQNKRIQDYVDAIEFFIYKNPMHSDVDALGTALDLLDFALGRRSWIHKQLAEIIRNASNNKQFEKWKEQQIKERNQW